jgi:Domain of unknown function (DUF4333)
LRPLRKSCWAALGVAVLVSLAGCGGDVDADKAQDEIKKGLEAQTKGDVKYVKCPEGVKAEKGATFKCEALIPVNVTQIDDDGNIRWQITSFVGAPIGSTGATGATGAAGATGTTAPIGPTGLTGPGPTPGVRGKGRDNRLVTYRNRSQGYSIRYIANMTQSGSDRDVSFTERSGLVFLHVVIHRVRGLPTVADARKAMQQQQGASRIREVKRETIGGQPAITARFTHRAPGTRIRQEIKRYIFARGAKRAVIEIGQRPNLLDNKPLQRRLNAIANSFRWLGSGT